MSSDKGTQMSDNAATVLVVDDIPANRNLLRDTLEPQGYEVLLAPDGETALKVSHRAQPDLILLDVMMPGLDGFETCRRLKGRAETRDIPVIFITARDETKAMVEGFQAGGVDYITKPFQAEEVLIRVKTHLENARLTRLVLEKTRSLQPKTNNCGAKSTGAKKRKLRWRRRTSISRSFRTWRWSGGASPISSAEASGWEKSGKAFNACSRQATPPFSSPAKAEPARNSWRAQFISAALGPKAHSFP